MKNLKLHPTCFLIFIFSFSFSTAISQEYDFHNRKDTKVFEKPLNNYSLKSNTRRTPPFNDYSFNNIFQQVLLKSDSTTKSVLVSNIMEEKSGDNSPVLGAATWIDNEKELSCRSLIEFNLTLLPSDVISNPALIRSAQLILFPLDVEFADHDNEKPSLLHVRQVLQNWNESTINWLNQPAADSILQNSLLIKKENRNLLAVIDVTSIVKNMIKKDNNGFMLIHENDLNESLSAGQLFASPKNGNPDIRPRLLITYVDVSQDSRSKGNASRDIF